ncbi:MAG TPA: dTDP-4-dehydrorhamnose reductase [Thermodesulfovibrionales bacterium]|nr:dTDP-4-dehydrorhamnose reductase [Thermodesulfovibrionales bacterium]
MKILVTGAGGMLASDLVSVLNQNHEVIPSSENDLNITVRDDVHRVVHSVSPDIVINCAAYTLVDKAEEERDKAFLVNGIGVQNIALACRDKGIPLCHISTDYVFDGTKKGAYTPFDNTNPINVYGESKLAGEKYVEWVMNKFYIVRTSWLYGRAGNNFVATILRLAKEQSEIRVVSDQMGSPTHTVSLSSAIERIIATGAYGIYHFTDETGGGISWYDFAKEIVRVSGLKTRVIPITTAEFPRPARRPANSVLDTSVFSLVTGHEIKDWKEALREYLSTRR